MSRVLPGVRGLLGGRAGAIDAGWTLPDLARRAGTSAPTVHRYESGWRRFEIATLERLAAALGCRLEIGRERFLDLVAGARFESGRTRSFWREMLRLEGRECTTRSSREEADASWMP